MTIYLMYFFLALAIGIGATLVMDIWLAIRERVFKIPSLNYCFLGRWILHMPEGVVIHRNIADARRKPWECTVGRLAHYSIGALFGVGLVMLTSPEWIHQPTILPAVLWGIVTVCAPFFIMQPALGFGIAASRSANPNKARIQSLFTHAVYGLGLYLSAWVASLLLVASTAE